MILPVLIERPSAAIRAELPWSSEAAVNNRSAAPEAEPFRDIPCKIAVFLHFHSSKVLSRIRIIRRNHAISGIIPQHNRRIKIPQEVPKHGISAINNTFFLCMAAHQTPSLEFRGFARERERRSLSLKLVEIFTSPMNTNTAFEHKIPIKKHSGDFSLECSVINLMLLLFRALLTRQAQPCINSSSAAFSMNLFTDIFFFFAAAATRL